MVGHRISFSYNLQTLKWNLYVAMVTDMALQLPLEYSPTIELQGNV